MARIGWASRDITPVRPAIIPGQMYVRIGRAAQDPLTLTAFAMDDGTPAGRALLISCDMTQIPANLQDATAAEVQRRIPELAGRPVVLCATHTHEAFLVRDGSFVHPGGDVMTAEEGRAWLQSHAVDAAVEAWAQRRPRRIGRAYGTAVIGHNRRAVYGDGRAVMYGKAADPQFRHVEGHEDHGVDMIFVWEEDGSIAGMVIDVPCPSQVTEHLDRFSADYWHDARVELRRRFGQHLAILPLCGAAGDLSPRDLVNGRQEEEMRQRRGVSHREEIARRIADAVGQALACTSPGAADMPIAAVSIAPDLPRRRITREERDWALARRTEYLQRDGKPDQWWPRQLQDVADRFDRDEPMQQVPATLHVIRLGDVVIATNPFELYLDFGMQIRARSAAAQTLLVQLAGGCAMYLPSARSALGGGYGSHPAVAPAGPEAGQALVEATLAAIAGLFPAEKP